MSTNQKELRAAFWRDNPQLSRRRIKSYDGKGRMYPTDTRVAFVEWLDAQARDGTVSQELAQRATLSKD